MTDFEYTTEVGTPESSFIDFLYYNANDRSVAVELEDDVYAYSNVEYGDFVDFVDADSVGNHYNTVFKPKYGPSVHLGRWSEIGLEEVRDDSKRVKVGGGPGGMASVHDRATTPTTPKGLNYDSVELDEQTKEFSLRLLPSVTLDDLTVEEPTREFSLASVGSRVASATNGDESYTVVFNSGRTYRPKGVRSISEAVYALREVAEMLDVDVDVEQVVVTFG